MAIYGDALARDPRLFEPHHLLALGQQGNVAEAYRLVSGALELKPCAAEALALLAGVLLALNRPAEALAACDRTLALSPNDVEMACNRVVILTRLDRMDEAIEQYREALARRPTWWRPASTARSCLRAVNARRMRSPISIGLSHPSLAISMRLRIKVTSWFSSIGDRKHW